MIKLKFRKTALPNPWLIFWATAFGAALASIDGGIVNVALPTLAREFQAPLSSIQWVISGYLLTICVLVPLGGRLGDIYTKRFLYLSGMFFFTLCSALCGLSSTLNELILFRLLQGIGAAFILALNQAIIMTNFPRKKQAQALGINAMIFSFSGLIGPTLGGFLIHFFHWRSIFYINIPIGLIGIVMCLKILPFEKRKSEERLDTVGSLLFAIGITCVLLALNYGAEWHWFSSKTLITFCAGAVVLLLFYRFETTAAFPMLDLSLFRNRSFFAGNVLMLMVLAILIMNMIMLPFYLQQVLHQSPAIVGLFVFIPPLLIMLTAPLSGYFTSRVSLFKLITVGLIIILLGWVVQLFYSFDTPFWLIVISQMLFGIGYGIFQPPNNFSTLNTISLEKMGVSAGITSLSKNVSKIIGMAFCVSVFQSCQQHHSSMKMISLHHDAAFLFGYKAVIISAIILTMITVLIACWQFKYETTFHGLKAPK